MDRGSDYANAVVLLDTAASVLGRYALADLLDEDEIATVERSDCGIHWREGARYFFLLDTSQRCYIALATGLVLEFSLEDGAFRRGSAGAFPALARVMKRAFANEEVESWSTSLRFSSLTDVLRGLAAVAGGRPEAECPSGTRSWVTDNPDGSWEEYCGREGPDGRIVMHGSYLGANLDGSTERGRFEQGERHGAFVYRDPDGRLLKIVQFENGTEISRWRF